MLKSERVASFTELLHILFRILKSLPVDFVEVHMQNFILMYVTYKCDIRIAKNKILKMSSHNVRFT